jgi:predicted CXXCH cytochrome family protein
MFCHAPHSGIGKGPLWSQKFATGQNYVLSGPSTSTTMSNTETTPASGKPSNLCLSCHDGTIAPGQTTPYGNLNMPLLTGNDILTTNMLGSHPFSLKLPLVDSSYLVPSIISAGRTSDPLHKVRMVGGNVECQSCHNPHAQSIDTVSHNFLVRDGSSGQICLACHGITPRTIANKPNPLQGWMGNIHSTATNKLSTTLLGSYSSVAMNACVSCHAPHNAASSARQLRNPAPPTPGMDSTTQNCMTCHNGGTNISPAIPNIYAEFAKPGHPFPSATNPHDAAETMVLNNNRHATCVDCHNPHTSLQENTFTAAPAIRPSQNLVAGVSAQDGITILNPAINQYENCFRCHGASANKPTSSPLGYLPRWLIQLADPFDVRQQFGSNAISAHPVVRQRSGNLEPSLLSSMLDITGKPTGRSMTSTSTQIFCTDCHNSDDNREIGGTGPVGPHGSQYNHILERRYEFSQVGASGPGTLVQNLMPTPSTNPDCSTYPCISPYALCAKCHNLTSVLSDSAGSFMYHSRHVSQDGFSCSVCHTGHGVPQAGTTTGVRLVNFDLNVVAPNASGPITYNPATQSCTLTCHSHQHGS